MRAVRAFALFWWDFIVGDDWRMAAGVVVLLGGGYLLDHRGVHTWWVMPVAVIGLLAVSLMRVVRRG